MTNLEKTLEEKILTCSVQDFFYFHNELNKKNYELIGVQVCKKVGSNHALTLSTNLYSEMAKLMLKEGYVAITDARLSEGYLKESTGEDKWEGTLYGTAIKLVK